GPPVLNRSRSLWRCPTWLGSGASKKAPCRGLPVKLLSSEFDTGLAPPSANPAPPSAAWLVQARWRIGKDLTPGLGHAHRMLVLGGELTIPRYGGPAVRQDLHVRLAEVDHGLDGENHPRLELRSFAWV